MDYDKSYDLVDGLGMELIALAAAVMTGIASVSLFGYSASGTLATFSGYSISYAFAVGIATLIGLMAYNDVGIGDLQDAYDDEADNQVKEDLVGVVLGVGGFAAVEFFTSVQNFVTGSDAIALIATIVMAVPAFIIVHRMGSNEDDN